MDEPKSLQLTQVGIGQFIMDIMAKINAGIGPEVLHKLDSQLHWVDVFLRGDEDSAVRVNLTIFDDFESGRGYDEIERKTTANMLRAVDGLFVVCSTCGEAITSLAGEVGSVPGQSIFYANHQCPKQENNE